MFELNVNVFSGFERPQFCFISPQGWPQYCAADWLMVRTSLKPNVSDQLTKKYFVSIYLEWTT